MLDPNEIAQVHDIFYQELAAHEKAVHTCHGTYTHLCAINGVVFYAHSAVGQVLAQFDACLPVEAEIA